MWQVFCNKIDKKKHWSKIENEVPICYPYNSNCTYVIVNIQRQIKNTSNRKSCVQIVGLVVNIKM